jgi:hypothetical protein
MVAGITTTYHAFNHVMALRKAVEANINLAANDSAGQASASEMKALAAALAQLVDGPSGFGTGHRDLARRLNDMLVGDFAPTSSLVAGVDEPCRAIDAALERLRQLETTTIAGLRAKLRSAPQQIPAWTAPSSGCGAK